MKMWNHELTRIATPTLSVIGIIAIFASLFYQELPAPLQLVLLKALLVSAGFLTAHTIGKLAFLKVDWNDDKMTPKHHVRIALYVICIYAFALGG